MVFFQDKCRCHTTALCHQPNPTSWAIPWMAGTSTCLVKYGSLFRVWNPIPTPLPSLDGMVAASSRKREVQHSLVTVKDSSRAFGCSTRRLSAHQDKALAGTMRVHHQVPSTLGNTLWLTSMPTLLPTLTVAPSSCPSRTSSTPPSRAPTTCSARSRHVAATRTTPTLPEWPANPIAS